MANFKRKRRHSKIKCGICAGQRRRFGMPEKEKKLLKEEHKLHAFIA